MCSVLVRVLYFGLLLVQFVVCVGKLRFTA